MATLVPLDRHQTYDPKCKAAIDEQIRLELYVSYVFMSMAMYFDKGASRHLAEFLLQRSSKEREHAERLMQLQNQRGSQTCLRDISRPDRKHWRSSLRALECALHLSKTVNQSLLNLHQLAKEKKDAHLCSYLDSHHLQGQVMFIKELGDHVTILRKMGAPKSGLAEYLFDKLTLGDRKKN